MTPNEVLVAAQLIMTDRPRLSMSCWARATAVVIRQALEMNMAAILRRRVPGVESATFEVQLLCLRDFLPDREVAERVAFTWGALSQSLHHNAYELPPAESELLGWMLVVDEFIKATHADS